MLETNDVVAVEILETFYVAVSVVAAAEFDILTRNLSSSSACKKINITFLYNKINNWNNHHQLQSKNIGFSDDQPHHQLRSREIILVVHHHQLHNLGIESSSSITL